MVTLIETLTDVVVLMVVIKGELGTEKKKPQHENWMSFGYTNINNLLCSPQYDKQLKQLKFAAIQVRPHV